jgi:type I restriction enzyme, S subunit
VSEALPAGWIATTVGETCSIVSGSTPKSGEPSNWNGDVPWITPDDLSRHSGKTILAGRRSLTKAGYRSCSTRMVPAGTLLYTSRAPIGYVAVAAQPVCTNQGFKSLVPPSDINSDYLYWYMRYATDLVKERASGTTFAEISGKAMATVPLLIAPCAEQERIVAAIEEQFSRLDSGVAALERARQNLKRMRAAVIQAAVTGRLVDQQPSEGTGADLLATIKMDGRRASRRSEDLITPMPPLPQSWATATWSTTGSSQNGRAFPSADYTAVGTRLLRPGNLHASGRVAWTGANTRCLPGRYASEFPTYLVGPNELVMNLTAQSLKDEFLGRVCMTGPHDEPVLLNQRIARLTTVGLNPRFIFYVLKSWIFRRFVDQLNTGSLIQHMFTSQLNQFRLPIPPRGEQDRIVERIEGLLTLLDHLEGAVHPAEKQAPALRSAILAAAFSGRLVPQDPTDEPASAILDRIASERSLSNGHKTRQAGKPRLLREEATA